MGFIERLRQEQAAKALREQQLKAQQETEENVILNPYPLFR